MPFYFPRSAEEEAYAAKALPSALGNEYGEPVIAERTIRITSNPIASGRWVEPRLLQLSWIHLQVYTLVQ